MSSKRLYVDCPYNVGIDCEKMACKHGKSCGWHPAVERERKQKIRNGEYPRLRPPMVTKKKEPQKRERGGYGSERRAKLRAEGKCTICGKENDRPDKWCCSACYARKRELQKARDAMTEM